MAIKAICRSDCDAEKLVLSLESSGFIDKTENGYIVHDWKDVNSKLLRNWENGGKGGRPCKKNPSGTQEKPNDNPSGTQEKPNDNPKETDKSREDKSREELTPIPPSVKNSFEGHFDPVKDQVLAAWKRQRESAGLAFVRDPRTLEAAVEAANLIGSGDADLEILEKGMENLLRDPEAREKWGLRGLVNNLSRWIDNHAGGAPKLKAEQDDLTGLYE